MTAHPTQPNHAMERTVGSSAAEFIVMSYMLSGKSGLLMAVAHLESR